MLSIITIIGARPQIIKAAALSRAFAQTGKIKEIIVHTGQHFDENMSGVFFDQMKIPKPEYMLNINGGGHGQMTGRMMIELENLLLNENPDYILVYGDTNTTLAGALVAKKKHIKLIHVEAGLRSFNMQMPEEVNRILTDRISDLLFCPTSTAVEHLKQEGFNNFDNEVIWSGDVMQDAAMMFSDIAVDFSSVRAQIGTGDFVLTTVHRAENTDHLNRLKAILEALNQLNKSIKVVCPLHPRTKHVIKENDLKIDFTVIDPVGYLDMIELLKGCTFVLTDSGGLQKEAYFFKKPCITLRDETEWTELVEAGVNMLAGADKSAILNAANTCASKPFDFSQEFYGGGKATNLIAQSIISHFEGL